MIERVDANGPTWLALSTHIEGRIVSLQAQLESDKDPATTAKIRGRIKELRELVARVTEPPRQ